MHLELSLYESSQCGAKTDVLGTNFIEKYNKITPQTVASHPFSWEIPVEFALMEIDSIKKVIQNHARPYDIED